MDRDCPCSSTKMQFRVIDNAAMDQFRMTTKAAMVKAPQVEKTFVIGNHILAAAGTEKGETGCVTIPIFGIPVNVCWEFLDLVVDPPAVTLEIRLTASVGEVEYLNVILKIACKDISNPLGCEIQVNSEKDASTAFSPSCDWECLRSCATGCITCGTDYWCWAACAVGCLWRCCSL